MVDEANAAGSAVPPFNFNEHKFVTPSKTIVDIPHVH